MVKIQFPLHQDVAAQHRQVALPQQEPALVQLPKQLARNSTAVVVAPQPRLAVMKAAAAVVVVILAAAAACAKAVPPKMAAAAADHRLQVEPVYQLAQHHLAATGSMREPAQAAAHRVVLRTHFTLQALALAHVMARAAMA